MPNSRVIAYEIDPFPKIPVHHLCHQLGAHRLPPGWAFASLFCAARGRQLRGVGLISFPSLEAYEAYRQRLREHDEAAADFAFAQRERFVRKEERTFSQAVSAS